MKRKNNAPPNGKSKKRAISDGEAHGNFRNGLFDPSVLAGYTDSYAASQPYVLPSRSWPLRAANAPADTSTP
jgi:hypothetical protein